MYQITSGYYDNNSGSKSGYLYGRWKLIWFLITKKYKSYSKDSLIDVRIYL
jgi:hypothetical protein